jgi:hypothetical protein
MTRSQHLGHWTTAGVAALTGASLLFVGCASSPAGDPAEEPASRTWTLLTTDADQPVALQGGAELAATVLVVDGLSGHASSPAPAELDTTGSFTVSAWVALGGEQPFATAVSQRGEVAGSFYLGVAEGRFAFSMKDADTNDEGHTVRATGAVAEVDADRWAHLAGTFDDDAGTITLYVDGAEAATTAFDAPIRVRGDLVIGGAQSHAEPSDFWPGAVAAVSLMSGRSDQDDVLAVMEATRPSGEPPVRTGPDPADQAAGALRGTWDYVYTADERALLAETLGPEAMAEIGDLTAARLGFDGSQWWQGFVGDGEVWIVDGAPEGDGGAFTVDGGTLTTGSGSSLSTYDWTLDGDSLRLVLVDCQAGGVPCTDTDMVRFITERTWTRSGTDPSY